MRILFPVPPKKWRLGCKTIPMFVMTFRRQKAESSFMPMAFLFIFAMRIQFFTLLLRQVFCFHHFLTALRFPRSAIPRFWTHLKIPLALAKTSKGCILLMASFFSSLIFSSLMRHRPPSFFDLENQLAKIHQLNGFLPKLKSLIPFTISPAT